MSERLFHKNFDIKSYASRRMLEIESLSDRVMYKEVVEHLFVELYRYHEAQYETLMHRILEEAKSKNSGYSVYIGYTTPEFYDETDTFLYPMIPEDVNRTTTLPDMVEVLETLEKKEPYYLHNVFLKMNYQDIERFKTGQQLFSGTIETTTGQYKAMFSLVFEERYLSLISSLYDIFIANAKPWITVCSAYLEKIFSLYLHKMIDDGLTGEIVDIKIDFATYSEVITKKAIPLWNICEVTQQTSAFPVPAKDKINFLHTIFAHQLSDFANYLVVNEDVRIVENARIENDLCIVCDEGTAKEWRLYELHQQQGEHTYFAPPLSNYYTLCFTNDLLDLYKRSVKTKLELQRVLNAFPYSKEIVYENIVLEKEEIKATQTYDMDRFIGDFIREDRIAHTMVLTFSASDPENYLNADLMSFLVSQVQKLFPEYRCIGKLV